MNSTPKAVKIENIVPERDMGKTFALEARGIGIDFGGLTAVDEFSIGVGPTEICGLIGPNGAGKTTIFNLLTNVYKPTRGEILIGGKKTAGKSTHEVNRMGIARTFQNIRLFSKMTVIENVKVALSNSIKCSVPESMLRLPRFFASEKEMTERALELLGVFGMQHMANWVAGSLPYGAQRRLEIVRALATNPKILLLDEPAAGLDPRGKEEIMSLLHDLKNTWCKTVIIVSHDMDEIAENCDRAAVFSDGKVLLEEKTQRLFASAKTLKDCGLGLPFTAQVLQELDSLGVQIEAPLNVSGFVKALSCAYKMQIEGGRENG